MLLRLWPHVHIRSIIIIIIIIIIYRFILRLQQYNRMNVEEASTHKTANTHASNVFVTLTFDLLTPK